MIYFVPDIGAGLDQGDLIDDCPIVRVNAYRLDTPNDADLDFSRRRVIVLTQTCDLAQTKAEYVAVASVFDADDLVAQRILKPADIKGPLRSGRVWGCYFLPARAELSFKEMIVDLRQLTTMPLTILEDMVKGGHRRARLMTPYREHLAKHFADTYCRIGLPQPYETL